MSLLFCTPLFDFTDAPFTSPLLDVAMAALEQLPRFPGVKDPDNRVSLTFKCKVPVGLTVTSVTVIEVDASGAAVSVPAFTFGAVAPALVGGVIWTAVCTCDGGSANPVVTAGVRPDPKEYFVRSRWVRSDGSTLDRTVRLYVGHN